jgi:Tfp pilus assembly major pilin PilA
MFFLTSVNDKLQIITDSTATVDCHTSYLDFSGSTVTPGRKNTAISTATTTDIVDAPGSGVQRSIKTLHIRNTHASTSVNVTVQHTDGTTVIILFPVVTLLTGEKLSYVEGKGWKLIDVNGFIKDK